MSPKEMFDSKLFILLSAIANELARTNELKALELRSDVHVGNEEIGRALVRKHYEVE